MSIDIDQCVFVGDRDQDSVVLGLADEECRLGSKIFRFIILLWPILYGLNYIIWSIYHPLDAGIVRFDPLKFNF